MSFQLRGVADRHVTVTEVGTRDGFQAEAAFIPTDTKAEIVDALIAAGVRSIEATSFVSPRAIPQLADAHAMLERVTRVPSATLGFNSSTTGLASQRFALIHCANVCSTE